MKNQIPALVLAVLLIWALFFRGDAESEQIKAENEALADTTKKGTQLLV